MTIYRLPNPLPWVALVGPIAAAESALARLDERLASSPIAAGWRSRNDVAAACAEAALAGHLVHPEDLVLHDARMDIRTPTADLTRAHALLRLRRRLGTCRASETWSLAEREALGPEAAEPESRRPEPDDAFANGGGEGTRPSEASVVDPDVDPELAAALVAVETAVMRVGQVLSDGKPLGRSTLLYDEGWDASRRRASWQDVIASTRELPAVLSAAVIADAWTMLQPVQHRDGLGWSLAGAHLRSRGTTSFMVGLAIGVRAVPRLRWQSPDPMTRILALLEALRLVAEAGRKDHERWLAARTALTAKLAGRRASSRLPALVDYVLTTPLVSANMIARELSVTPRAAQTMVAELGLRELTGRGRYRAWGIL